jgi:hypothetical protein
MHDHEILRVHEALLKYVKAKLTNYPQPKPKPKLEGVSRDIYAKRLPFLEEMERSYSLKEIQGCLKMLEKSLKVWNREYGSRGYLISSLSLAK